MNEVIAADTQGIPVARDDPDREIGIGDLDARGNGRGPPMDTVKSVGVHVIGETAGTADPGDKDEFFARNVELWQDLLDLGQDGIIPTTGTPTNLLIGDKVLAGRFRRFCIVTHGRHGSPRFFA